MPAATTHLIFARKSLDYLDKGKNSPGTILSADKGLFLFGAVAPDIPYLHLLTTRALKTVDEKVADSMHYDITSELPMEGFRRAKIEFERGNRELGEAIFSFFAGYTSHLIADGITHPFVRDMVGDYKVAKVPHRSLELQLDVLMAKKYYNTSLNGVSIHDDIQWVEESKFKNRVFSIFAGLLGVIHGHSIDSSIIETWKDGLVTSLDIAEGETPEWYQGIVKNMGIAYLNYELIKKDEEKIVTLREPIDMKEKGLLGNFLGKEEVHFFKDIVPHFFEIYPKVIEEAHKSVFQGQPLREDLIPAINLDTGRSLSAQALTNTPTLWA